MPRLWTETIETHRREVADAILEATAQLLEHLGLRDLTMSRVAETAGIGRATLYKYYPDVDAILVAVHERHVDAVLAELVALGAGPGEPVERLRSVLQAYATLRQGHHGTSIERALQGSAAVASAHKRLHELFCSLLTEGLRAGSVRDDVPPAELATFCLHALAAAADLSSKAAAPRLVDLILGGLVHGSARQR